MKLIQPNYDLSNLKYFNQLLNLENLEKYLIN